MSREQSVELVQEWVLKNHITTLGELCEECRKYGLDWYDDVLSPLEWNVCDRCLGLEPSESLYWLEYMEEVSESLLNGIEAEGKEYNTLCPSCVKELTK